MENKTIVAIVAAVIIIAALVYFTGGGRAGGGANASIVLLNAVEKSANLTTYAVDRSVVIDGAVPINSSSLVMGEKKRVIIWDGLGVKRTVYFLPEGKFICLGEPEVCFKVEETGPSDYRAIVNYAAGQIGTPDVGKTQRWVSTGVIEPTAAVSESSIAGRPCQLISYSLRFDKMSDSDLSSMGWDRRTSLAVSEAVVDCVDKETGAGLYTRHNSTVLGESKITTFNTTLFDPKRKPMESDFALRGALVGESAFRQVENEELSRRQCLLKPSEAEIDRCFEAEAYNRNSTTFCSMIAGTERRDLCYMVFLPLWKDEGICENVQSAKDDCYFEVATTGIDAKACSRIAGKDYGALCFAIVGGRASGCTGLLRADECYYNIARNGKNATVCNSIVNATLKGNCMRDAGAG